MKDISEMSGFDCIKCLSVVYLLTDLSVNSVRSSVRVLDFSVRIDARAVRTVRDICLDRTGVSVRFIRASGDGSSASQIFG